MLSGLITSAGIGYLVLFKENKNLKENIIIVLIMLFIGIITGVISSLFVL